MKLEEPVNKNYAAIIVRVPAVKPLDGLDRLFAVNFFGYQALVDGNVHEGDLGVVFPPEVQLSDSFVKMNNLYRHHERNNDPECSGYIEDSRRVKAIKLRGHRSDCLYVPLEDLAYTGVDLSGLNEGDTFDKLGSQEICRKYVIKESGVSRLDKNSAVKFTRVDNVQFPLHIDTENYMRNRQNIPDDALITVTQKIHGTSLRVGNIRVNRQLKWYEKLAKKLGVKVAEEEYAHIYGSRRTIKDPENPTGQSYYGEDIYSREGSRFIHSLPEDYIVYAEIIGWVGENSPIQKDYTYNLPNGECEVYVYRIAHVSNGGRTMVDLSWDQVMQMCEQNGWSHVPELWRGKHKDFDPTAWTDIRFYDFGFRNAVPLSGSKKLVDEGVCIRMERLVPYVLKHKSPIFLQAESKMLDEGILDIETANSEA